MDIKQILQKYWGHSSFRPLQEDIINSVLEGRDALALMPTGGGKSICFQVPALYKEGICLVITPLIALMKDQVANLYKRGINAVAVYSGMSSREIDIMLDNCVYGSVKFLYVSPERLTTDLLRSRLQKMNVNLVAIDEAHCISQWGYDFRPPYLRIAEIRQYTKNAPFLALTATATTKVIDDICEKLEFQKQNVFRKSFERKNLVYAVLKEEDKLKRLNIICNKIKGIGIVYVRNRRKTREISDFLNKNGIVADYYHAGLDNITREKKQIGWMSEKTRVVVATNAFGMGIDKPNVRFVAHMDLPDSPESYFQEAGRAGRDLKKSYAVLLFNKADILDAQKFLELSYPSLNFIKKVYNTLGNYLQIPIGGGINTSHNFELNSFCDNYQFNPVLTFNAIRFLEKEGYVAISEALRNPSRIIFLLNKEELYRFQVANPKYDPVIKTLLRSYTGLFTSYCKIDENEIAKRLNISKENFITILKRLKQYNIIDYQPQNEKPLITFLTERIIEKNLTIAQENYHNLKKRAYERMDAMINYAQSENKCRSLMLLDYFGEKSNDPCGNCDVCLERNKLNLSKQEFDKVVEIVKPILTENPMTIDQLMTSIKTNIPEKKIIKVIQWLKDHNKVIFEPGQNIMKWNNDNE